MADKNEYDGDEGLDEEELPVDEGGVGPKLAHVETKSGEEQYDELCKVKAKIWRFDEGENVWKERGQGDAKVLRDKVNKKKYVFIFRREGIGKLAAFHAIVPGMMIKPFQGNEKNLMWATLKDYTDDEEGFPEKFIMKFSAKEIADEFRLAFTDAVTNGQASA